MTIIQSQLIPHHDKWPEPTYEEQANGYRVLHSTVKPGVLELTLPKKAAESHRTTIHTEGNEYRVSRDQNLPQAPETIRIDIVPERIEVPDVDKLHAHVAGKPMDYFLYDADSPEERAALGLPSTGLKASPRLLSAPERHKGFHTTYVYVSLGPSVTMWHIEDMRVGSINWHRGGDAAVWFIIPSCHSERFETAAAQQSSLEPTCSQFVRHDDDSAINITPAILRKWNIKFFTVLQYPGDLVETFPGVYHMVVNLGNKVAEAVNCCDRFWTPSPFYKSCGMRCGRRGKQITSTTVTPTYPPGQASRAAISAEKSDGSCRDQGFTVPTGEHCHNHDNADVQEATIASTCEAQKTTSVPTSRRKRYELGLDPASETNSAKRKCTSADLRKGLSNSYGSLEGQPGRDLLSTNKKHLTRRNTDVKDPKPLSNTGRKRQASPLPELGRKLRKTQPEAAAHLVIESLVEFIFSRSAVLQFQALVYSRRSPDEIRDTSVGHDHERIVHYINQINAAQNLSDLKVFEIRLYQLLLVEEIEVSNFNLTQLLPTVKERILSQTRLDPKTLPTLRRKGTMWRRLCGSYSGLLCFIPLLRYQIKGVSEQSLLAFKEVDFEYFHSRLDDPYVRSLCSAGAAFQTSLSYDAEDVGFKFEGEKIASNLSRDQLAEIIQPVKVPEENDVRWEEYPNWPHPPDVPQEVPWPMAPDLILDDKPCDFCDAVSCDCVKNVSRMKPRIMDRGRKGRGLIAIADKPDTVACKMNERIGYLIGYFTPIDTPVDKPDKGMIYEVVREDIGPICQLNCQEIGTLMRYVNNDCKSANARFETKKVSGKYRVILVADKDIWHGDEITVKYGGKFWGGAKGEKCLCRSCNKTRS